MAQLQPQLVILVHCDKSVNDFTILGEECEKCESISYKNTTASNTVYISSFKQEMLLSKIQVDKQIMTSVPLQDSHIGTFLDLLHIVI